MALKWPWGRNWLPIGCLPNGFEVALTLCYAGARASDPARFKPTATGPGGDQRSGGPKQDSPAIAHGCCPSRCHVRASGRQAPRRPHSVSTRAPPSGNHASMVRELLQYGSNGPVICPVFRRMRSARTGLSRGLARAGFAIRSARSAASFRCGSTTPPLRAPWRNPFTRHRRARKSCGSFSGQISPSALQEPQFNPLPTQFQVS